MSFDKGHTPWNKGLKGKQVAWNKGTKGIMKAWNKGKKFSVETRQKMSKSKIGKIPWNKGLKGVIIAWNKGKKAPWTSARNKRDNPKRCGEKHWKWKGGMSKGYKLGYYSTKYKEWRKAVFERDSYICQICKAIGVYLTAHHIKSFAHYPKLRFNIGNGITLCEDCHKLTDNYKGRAKNNN